MVNAFDTAWSVVKAVEVTPSWGGKDQFRAYRAIPSDFVDQVLEEGIVPRPVLPHYGRPAPDSKAVMEAIQQAERGEAFKYPEWPHDEAVYTFRHQRQPVSLRQWQQKGPFNNDLHPLLMAQFFSDAWHGRPMSIIGSRITPPGPVWQDPDFQPGIGYRATMSVRPIAPQHLEEVIPVFSDGEEIRYREGRDMPDRTYFELERLGVLR